MKNFFLALIPPPQWRPVVLVLLAGAVGIGSYSLYISNALAYLSDDPKACVNCHIMAPQYATWQNGSHARVAVCTDCHVPHDNIFRKYYFKAQDGLRHASMFTLRMEPQVIHVKEAGAGVIQENCIRCHQTLLNDTFHITPEKQERSCWSCHRETPHGRVNSLSSVPNARVPVFNSPVSPAVRQILATQQDSTLN
ncbi:MAG: cytochrome c nitrite reductase small subunit [Bacteroidetes bacterium]|nr:cytochrome c nitrite reductase small subunit [Bacteroidota bacterium]